jgi:glyoxylase-like metal-dependent hydrolase (beta-lactamase superfamily II)
MAEAAENGNSRTETAMRTLRPHRRAFVAGLGATLAAPALGLPARAALAPFRRNLGAIELTVVSDGTLSVPLSFALPETPATEAAALFTAHGLPPQGAPGQTNVTLVKSGNDLILIDAGSGPKFQPTAGKLSENLEAAGIDPAKISKVVFTHAHADHLWGVIDDFDDGRRFPNASYVISAVEWDFWTDPKTASLVPDWLKGMASTSGRILKQIEDRIERRKAGDTVGLGLTYLETAGHTPGHMAVLVESGNERLLIGGDVFNNHAVSFAKPDWRIGSDYDRDQGIATRKRMLDRLATDRIPLIGFHIAWPGHGMVERNGPAYRFVPI